MEVAPDLVLAPVRCASVHGSAGVDPAGTAPVWDAVLVAEVPLPWPRDIGAMSPFAELADQVGATIRGADGRAWRPQAVVPESASRGVRRPVMRVMAFERPLDAAAHGRAGPYRRREWLVDGGAADAVELCAALVAADESAIDAFADVRADAAEDTVDLLVCTHGSRDRCCGAAGPVVHQELARRLDDLGTAGVRLWRTSHTGGHRFAATALSLPDGIAWAHLDAGVAEAVVRREGAAAEVAPHCRGSLSLDGAPAQVADREALARFGWDWARSERQAVVVAHERDTLATTLEVRASGWAAEGPAGVRVRVELDRHIAMPTCGRVEGPELVTEPVWRVASVEELTGGRRRDEPSQ